MQKCSAGGGYDRLSESNNSKNLTGCVLLHTLAMWGMARSQIGATSKMLLEQVFVTAIWPARLLPGSAESAYIKLLNAIELLMLPNQFILSFKRACAFCRLFWTWPPQKEIGWIGVKVLSGMVPALDFVQLLSECTEKEDKLSPPSVMQVGKTEFTTKEAEHKRLL